MTLDQLITNIEYDWKSKLYKASCACFKGIGLPSHNHKHHYRVWIYAKELVKTLSENHHFSYNYLTNLIIACFFHDTGMSVTTDERHGKEGALLCQQYFKNTSIHPPENLNSTLEAIEHHDNKTYQQGFSDKSSLTTILSTADDLDAFGYFGILRYAEIYLLRNISIEELGQRVMENAQNRFRNFENNFGQYPGLIEKHQERMKILLDFYQELPQKAYNRKIIDQVNKKIHSAIPPDLLQLLDDEFHGNNFSNFKNKLEEELALFGTSTENKSNS
jgi:HD superfamily phosphodiesterase